MADIFQLLIYWQALHERHFFFLTWNMVLKYQTASDVVNEKRCHQNISVLIVADKMRNAGHLLAPSLQQALVAFSHALPARAFWRLARCQSIAECRGLLPAILVVLHLVLQAHPRSVQKHTIVDSGDMLDVVPNGMRTSGQVLQVPGLEALPKVGSSCWSEGNWSFSLPSSSCEFLELLHSFKCGNATPYNEGFYKSNLWLILSKACYKSE